MFAWNLPYNFLINTVMTSMYYMCARRYFYENVASLGHFSRNGISICETATHKIVQIIHNVHNLII